VTALVLIPARHGSKGVPGKNLREVAGISLVGRAVRAGRRFLAASGTQGMVLVDTDSETIADEGRRWGASVPFLRPAALAADATPMIDNVLAAMDRLDQFDSVVLLQPTSPLRTEADIFTCWSAHHPQRAPSIVSVTPSTHPPEQSLRLGSDAVTSWAWPDILPEARRQDYQPSFRPSGAVYVNTSQLLRRERSFFVAGVTRGVVLPAERSIDVDTIEDLAMADYLARAVAPQPVRVGDRTIGGGHRCFIIATAAVEDGRGDAVRQAIDAAADAGADAVAAGMSTGPDAWAALQRHAAGRGVSLLPIPGDEASGDLLEGPAFRLPAVFLANAPLLRRVAAKGRPILLSTETAGACEVAAAVDALEAASAAGIALLHGSPGHLRAASSMQAAFGHPVGWRDRGAGVAGALAAVALGVPILERPFAPGNGELAALVAAIRAVEASLG
jgi:CMP-N-acetylneuraminic acid synthetase